jgi:hypothetical protein
MTVDDILGSELLADAVRKGVGAYLAMDIPLYEKCTDVSRAIYDSVKEACGQYGVVAYLVKGSWRGLATEAFSAKSNKQSVSMDHDHEWLMFADGDVFVHTIEQGYVPPNDEAGPRQDRSAYFYATACQFTGQPWSFEACFGPDVEAALVQEYAWTV